MDNKNLKATLERALDTELAMASRRLAEKDPLLAEALSVELNILRSAIAEKAEAASEMDERQLLPEQIEGLLNAVEVRFKANMYRHPDITWGQVEQRLREADSQKLWSLNEMEKTGGEPDVLEIDKRTGETIFYDCSAESPDGRRNCVYDLEGEKNLKKNCPNETCNSNAVGLAKKMGISLLTEAEYRELQTKGGFDLNSWSWIQTPVYKRKESVALNGHRFQNVVRTAESDVTIHFSNWAFRGLLRV